MTLDSRQSPVLIYPNTMTLVDIILNRIQTDKLLNVAGYEKVVKPR